MAKKKLCLILRYKGANSYLFVNGKEIMKFKAKDSEIGASPICLGNISKDWSEDNMKNKQVLMDMFTNLMLIIGILIPWVLIKLYHLFINIL